MIQNDILMFSVIVITYNQKDYIIQTLQSIIDQKHKYKYELLVSDDCSSDGTQEVLRYFSKKYPSIIKVFYNTKNLGAMKNFYKTARYASGKYIMGCGGDDYWLPGKVESQISFMENNTYFSVCYGKVDVFTDSLKKITGKLGSNYLDFKELLIKGNFIPAITLCMRRVFFFNYLDEINPEQKNWLMEDYPFLIYTAFNSNIYFINETFAVYRVINNSISHQTDTKKKIIFEKSVYDIRKYFSILYNIEIEPWDDTKFLPAKKRKILYTIYSVLKRICKNVLPYGIVTILRKLKELLFNQKRK